MRNQEKSFVLLFVTLLTVSAAANAEPPTPQTATVQPTVSAPGTETKTSLITLLKLDGKQIESLDTLYKDYAHARLEQEARIARAQDTLKENQNGGKFDARRSSRLTREMTDAQQHIADTFFKARAAALALLTPAQQKTLTALQNGNRATVTEDTYWQMLLVSTEAFWQTPVDTTVARALLDADAFEARSPAMYTYINLPYRFYAYGHELRRTHPLFFVQPPVRYTVWNSVPGNYENSPYYTVGNHGSNCPPPDYKHHHR